MTYATYVRQQLLRKLPAQQDLHKTLQISSYLLTESSSGDHALIP